MFRAFPLPIIRSPLTVHLALVYVIRFEGSFRAGPETCRGLFFSQNKIWEVSTSVGFIIKKFVTIHGHMNVQKMLCIAHRPCITHTPPFSSR